MNVRRGAKRRGLWAIGVAVLAVGVASGAFAASSDVSPTPFGIPTNKIPDPSGNITAVRGDQWF